MAAFNTPYSKRLLYLIPLSRTGQEGVKGVPRVVERFGLRTTIYN
jgi:hypothetical protein